MTGLPPDVEVGVFRKSRNSGSANDCVEVADLSNGGRAIRDSKMGANGPVLFFTAREWAAFTAGVKEGEFD